MNKLSYDLQLYLLQQLKSDSDPVLHLVCREVCHSWGQVDVSDIEDNLFVMLLIEYYIYTTGDTSILQICPEHQKITETCHKWLYMGENDVMSSVIQLGDVDMLKWIKEKISDKEWRYQTGKAMWELSFCKPEFIRQCLEVFDMERTDIVEYLYYFIHNGSGQIVKWIVNKYGLTWNEFPIHSGQRCIGYAFSSLDNPDDEVTKYIARFFQFQFFDLDVYLRMAIERESVLPWMLEELDDQIDRDTLFSAFHFIADPLYNIKFNSIQHLIDVYDKHMMEFTPQQAEKLYLLALQRFHLEVLSFLQDRFSALLHDLDKKEILNSLHKLATNHRNTVEENYFRFILTFHTITDRDLLTGNGCLFLELCKQQPQLVTMLMQTYDFIFPHHVKQILEKKYPNLVYDQK